MQNFIGTNVKVTFKDNYDCYQYSCNLHPNWLSGVVTEVSDKGAVVKLTQPYRMGQLFVSSVLVACEQLTPLFTEEEVL